MNRLSWRVFAAIGGVGLLLYFLIPPSPGALVYDAFGLACVAAALWRATSGKLRSGRGAWLTFALANALWVSGDIVAGLLEAAAPDGVAPFPSVADGLYLSGYPVVTAAIIWAARLRGPRRDFLALLDGVMIAAASTVPVYVLWIGPSLKDTELGTFATAVSLAYPVMDLLLIAAAVRFLLGSGRWNTSALLLAAGLVLTTVADTVYNVELFAGTYVPPDPVDFGYLLSYLLWGLAALHPSATDVLEPGARKFGVSSPGRAWLLIAIVVLPVTVVAWSYVQGTPLDLLVVVLPLAVIGAVMVWRLRLLARTGSGAWRGGALLATAAFMVILVAAGLAQVQATSTRQEQLADELVEAVVIAEQLDTVAVTAVSQAPGSSLQATDDYARLTAQLRHQLALVGGNLSPIERATLSRLVDRYTTAVATQLQFVAESRWSQVISQGEEQVLPAREALVAATRRAVVVFRAAADTKAHRGRLGSVFVLTVALLLLCLLLVRFGGLSRSAHLAEVRNRATRESESRFRALVGGSADILTVIDVQTTVIAHSETVERVLGYAEGTILGQRLDALLSDEDAERTRETLVALAGRPGASEMLAWQVHRPDGTVLDAEASIVNHLDDPLLGGFVVNVRDVSERKLLEAELEHQAFHDPLTGLANRGLLEDRLRQAFGRAARDPQPQALVFLDIDDFKAFNDALGHPAGDAMLRHLATLLEGCLRAPDTLARVGGDAFAILIEDCRGPEAALETAERMLATLAEPLSFGWGSHQVRASVGVALSDGAGHGSLGDQAALLVRNAELAMYEAKRQDGSSIELFVDRMHDAVTKRLAIQAELTLALERQEFTLVYQPIVNLAERRIVGYEALVRWIHPERGMVSPADFIPVAEQTGQIVALGSWVLREACRQLAEWQRAWGDERYVSVNVASQQLQREDFAAHVSAALADSGLPARQLLLEVTESSLINDTVGSERRVNALRQLGVGLAIDDFGTGYSSLSYLHRFSFDVLKIDKSFIDHITEDGSGNALVDAIVNMARSLRLRVVAEGMEQSEQVEALALMRCELGQGYHYSRPLPAADVPGFELAPGPAAPVISPLGLPD